MAREVYDGSLVFLKRRSALSLPLQCSVDDGLGAYSVGFCCWARDPSRVVVGAYPAQCLPVAPRFLDTLLGEQE
jgi:hypothetical protein